MAATKNLDDVMEFDHPVMVKDGEVLDAPNGIYAPELTWFEGDYDDSKLEAQAEKDGWELLRGYTGQQGYRGPIMHTSEFIGGGLEKDILAEDGVYVAVSVESENRDDQPVGWAVARKLES